MLPPSQGSMDNSSNLFDYNSYDDYNNEFDNIFQDDNNNRFDLYLENGEGYGNRTAFEDAFYK